MVECNTLRQFRSPEGQARYLAAYDAALSLWPVPYTSHMVPTRWGQTHVLSCGPEDGPPVVLLHGMSLSATMWFANAADLSRDHRLYAVDTIGSASKSLATQPLKNRADCAAWLNDVLDGLGLAQTALVGHSHGGWLATNYALSAPERLDGLVLLAPAGSLRPLCAQFYLRGIPLMAWPRRVWILSFMAWMTAEWYDVPGLFVEQFVLGMQQYRSQIHVWPTVYTDDELRQIAVPTLLLIGDREVIYDPRAALTRAQRCMPNLEAELVPGANHGLPMEQAEWVDKRILGFLRESLSRPASCCDRVRTLHRVVG